jgi:hypothetical protein
VARIEFGISGIEFGRMTYRVFHALTERVNIRRKLEDNRAAQICSATANFSGYAKRFVPPEDFFHSLRPPRPKVPSPNEIRSFLRDFNAMQKA